MSALLILSLALTTPPGDPPLPEGAVGRLGSPQWRNVADSNGFLTFTPDGKGVIVAHEGVLRAIDFETGKELWKVVDGGYDLKGAIAPGERIVLSSDAKLRMFAAANGKEEKKLQIDIGNAGNVACDGRYAAVNDPYGPTRGATVVFDMNSGQRIWEYGGARFNNRYYYPVGFVAGQSQLVTRVYQRPDTFIAVLDVKAKKVVREWKVPGPPNAGPMPFAVLSPDGKLLCSGTDKAVRLWDVATGKESGAWNGHSDDVIAAAFSADGQSLLTAAKDRTLRRWNVATGKEEGKIDVGRNPWLIAMSPNGERAVAACGGESTLRRFDLKAGKELPIPDGHTNLIEQLAFLPDSRTLVTAGRDGTVRVWDIAGRREIRQWRPKCLGLAWISVSADGKLAATGSYNDKLIEIWDIATGSALRSWQDPDGSVGCLAFAPTGTTLATGSRPTRLWDAATGKETGKLDTGIMWSGRLSFDSTGKRLLTSIGDRDIMFMEVGGASRGASAIWDIKSGRSSPLSADIGIRAVFSPDRRTVAMNRFRRRLETETYTNARFVSDLVLVELASGTARMVFSHRPSGSDWIEFSPDGRFVAVPPPTRPDQRRRDDGICLLDSESGKQLKRFASGYAWCFAISPDGKTLATGELDGIVQLWDVSKLRPKDEPVEVTDSLWSDLAGEAPKAYQAVVKLGHAGERGVAFLRERLKPATAPEKKKLDALFADLESEKYAVRQKAAAELAALAVTGEVLRERLKATNSAEARAAITKLLEGQEGWLTEPVRLRQVRAVEALQRNATPAAKKLLEEYAAGDPAARLTQEAREALQLMK